MESITGKITRYEQVIISYLDELAEERNTALGGSPDCNVIADTKNHHYQLTRIGWHGRKYYFVVLLHFSIKPDGKIWLQQNNTEVLVGQELEVRGIDKMDIVVGFRPEYLREATGYAVA
ncbi:MAG: XisI protein [Saprospiraceae bacterium]|nr:XisI protein [Saprospiraceae bacterium]